MNVLYTAEATAWAGRNGRAASSDGSLDVTLVPPKELGGTGAGTNPEQLFAAGYAGCFHSALLLVAKAHAVCPYSNATRGNVDVQVGVVD